MKEKNNNNKESIEKTMRRFLQTDPKELEELERKEKEKKEKSKSKKKDKK